MASPSPVACFRQSVFLYLPLPDSLFLFVEADAHLHHRQSAEGEAFGILLQVYLAEGGIGTLV